MFPAGCHQELDIQTSLLKEALLGSPPLRFVLARLGELPCRAYAGAGCLAQTVWNRQAGNDPAFGISDIDLVYFDPDLSYEAEDRVVRMAGALFAGCGIPVDVKNQARVHLWYRSHYGYDIAPYPSLGAAVATWPTTASAVAVRLEGDALRVLAPFGLGDLFGQTVRANKAQITRDIYLSKAGKWKRRWPFLRVIPWEA